MTLIIIQNDPKATSPASADGVKTPTPHANGEGKTDRRFEPDPIAFCEDEIVLRSAAAAAAFFGG